MILKILSPDKLNRLIKINIGKTLLNVPASRREGLAQSKAMGCNHFPDCEGSQALRIGLLCRRRAIKRTRVGIAIMNPLEL